MFTSNTWRGKRFATLCAFTSCTLDKESAIINLDCNVFTETVDKYQISHLSG